MATGDATDAALAATGAALVRTGAGVCAATALTASADDDDARASCATPSCAADRASRPPSLTDARAGSSRRSTRSLGVTYVRPSSTGERTAADMPDSATIDEAPATSSAASAAAKVTCGVHARSAWLVCDGADGAAIPRGASPAGRPIAEDARPAPPDVDMDIDIIDGAT